MKKRWYTVIVAVLLCVVLLAGCSCAPASSQASSAPVSAVADDAPPGSPQEVGQTGSDAKDTGAAAASGSANPATSTSAGTAQPAAQPTADPNKVQTFTGIIDSAGMGVYYVMQDDGLVIEVPQDGLDDSGLTDTMPGAKVTVSYRGTLNGNDTSGITFISIANA